MLKLLKWELKKCQWQYLTNCAPTPPLTQYFILQMHHRNVNDRRETIKNIKRLIRRKEKDNEQLDADLEELALSVAERRNVNEANG